MTISTRGDDRPLAQPRTGRHPDMPAPPTATASRWRRVLSVVMFSLLVLAGWQLYTVAADVNPLLLPSPWQVAHSVVTTLACSPTTPWSP